MVSVCPPKYLEPERVTRVRVTLSSATYTAGEWTGMSNGRKRFPERPTHLAKFRSLFGILMPASLGKRTQLIRYKRGHYWP